VIQIVPKDLTGLKIRSHFAKNNLQDVERALYGSADLPERLAFRKGSQPRRVASQEDITSKFHRIISLDEKPCCPRETMKMHLVVAFIGLANGFVPATLAQQKDTVDPQTAVQIRALASKYDAAFDRQDAAAVATLYTQDVVFKTPNGPFNGRQAIQELFAKRYFEESHSRNAVTTVEEVIADGNEVRATGIWSDTFEDASSGTLNADGTFSWVLVHEGDTWRIRESTFEITNLTRDKSL
jgi:uncharacterized protein (TIGR02246 family)